MSVFKKTLILILLFILVCCGAFAESFDAKITSKTKVYASARTSAASISVSGGTTVKVVACNKGWAKVKVKGKTGYMKSGKLKPDEGSKKANIVALAMLQLGKSYGKNEPSSFNCSSLVKYCYEKYGVRIHGNAKDIAKDSSLSTVSSVSDLKEGDIVCFDSNGDGSCDHVAIFAGDSRFIEASQNAGRVQINKMDSWYRKHFMCGKRI